MDCTFWLMCLIRYAILGVLMNPFLSIRVNISDNGKTDNNPYYILYKHDWLRTLSALLILEGGYYQLILKVPLSLTPEDCSLIAVMLHRFVKISHVKHI